MKKILFLIVFIFSSIISYGQHPGFNYQGAAKNSDGTYISDQIITLKISIISKTPDSLFYSESHKVKTDLNGRFSLIIGQGSVEFGTFSAINWMSSELYLKTKMDAGAGLEDMGEARVLPVPLASYAMNTIFDYNIKINKPSNFLFLGQGKTSQNLNLNVSSYMYDLEEVKVMIPSSVSGVSVEPSEFNFVPENNSYPEVPLSISVDYEVEQGNYQIPITGISSSGRQRTYFINLEVFDDSATHYFAGKTFQVKDYRYSMEDLIEYNATFESLGEANQVRLKFNGGPEDLGKQIVTITSENSGFRINITPENPQTGTVTKEFDQSATLQSFKDTFYLIYRVYENGISKETRQVFFTLID